MSTNSIRAALVAMVVACLGFVPEARACRDITFKNDVDDATDLHVKFNQVVKPASLGPFTTTTGGSGASQHNFKGGSGVPKGGSATIGLYCTKGDVKVEEWFWTKNDQQIGPKMGEDKLEFSADVGLATGDGAIEVAVGGVAQIFTTTPGFAPEDTVNGFRAFLEGFVSGIDPLVYQTGGTPFSVDFVGNVLGDPAQQLSASILTPDSGQPLALGAVTGPLVTTGQAKCINTMNKNLRKVASVIGKELCGCINDHNKGRISDIAQCVVDDQEGKIGTAQGRTVADASTRCTGTDGNGAALLPSFGVTDAATVNAAAMDKELALLTVIYGPDVEATAIDEATDRKAAKCQAAVAKTLKKCQDTKLNEFNKCKKQALASGQSLTACVLLDRKDHIAKKCDLNAPPKIDGIRKALQTKCVKQGVALSTAFPHCGSDDLETVHTCLETPVECLTCLAIARADDLDTDCELADNRELDGSCGGGTTAETECADVVDNDSDGLRDCADPDCAGLPPCP